MYELQPVEGPPPDRSDLAGRFKDPRTLLSFAVLIPVILLFVTGLISFRLSLPHRYEAAFAVGIGIAVALLSGLVGLRFTRGRISRLLPVRFRGHASRFKGGLLNAFKANLPL